MSTIVGLVLAAILAWPAGGAVARSPADEPATSLARVLRAAATIVRDLAVYLEDTAGAVSLAPGADVVRAGPRSSQAVALTFDDGFNQRACAHIARTLRARGAVGTFFINGRYLKAEPERWRRILRGMEVGNHTRSHRDLSREPHPVVRAQIRHNEAIHERVLGRSMLPLLRPPYGIHGDRLGRIAKELGYDRIVLWNVDTGDWRPGAKPRGIIARVKGARPGSVVLMHCSRDATARALPAIIRHFRSRGIRLAGLSEVLRLPDLPPAS